MTRPFARVRRPDAHPGHCIRCVRNEDLIDLGSDPLPGYGVAYLCTVCFFEMITAAGLVERATYDMTVHEYQNQVAGLTQQIKRLQATIPADGITPTPQEVEHLNGVRNLLDRLAAAGRPGGGGDAVAAPASAGAALAGASQPGGGSFPGGFGVRVDARLPNGVVLIESRRNGSGDLAEPDGVDHGVGLVREGVDPFDFLQHGADDTPAG